MNRRNENFSVLPARIFQRQAKALGVAQISNLLYRRFLIGKLSEPLLTMHTASGLETRDTADWKSALRKRGAPVATLVYEICRLEGGQRLVFVLAELE